MKTSFVKILTTLLIVIFTIPILAKDKKAELLELLYKQENYKSVIKKSDKYLRKNYQNKSLIHYMKALSYYQLSNDNLYSRKHSDIIEKSIKEYALYKQTKKEQSLFNKDLTNMLSAYHEESQNLMVSPAFANYYDSINIKSKKDALKNTPPKSEKKVEEKKKKVKKNTSVAKKESKELSHADSLISFAETFKGVPYKYGGIDAKGFDCSGFSSYVYKEFDIVIPRMSNDQYSYTKAIPIKKAQKGDLVFFGKSKNSISHVGIVVSNPGEELSMIHASSSRGIMITNIENSTYWKPKLIGVGRVP